MRPPHTVGHACAASAKTGATTRGNRVEVATNAAGSVDWARLGNYAAPSYPRMRAWARRGPHRVALARSQIHAHEPWAMLVRLPRHNGWYSTKVRTPTPEFVHAHSYAQHVLGPDSAYAPTWALSTTKLV